MWRIALLAALLVALAAPAAEAGPRPTAHGVTTGFVFSDGDMAAFQDEHGAVHVYESGRWRTVPPPDRPCFGQPPPLAAAGGGVLLFDVSCDEAGVLSGAVVRVTTGTVRYMEPIEEMNVFRQSFTGVGRRWVRVSAMGYHWRERRFVDWRTGAVNRDEAPKPSRLWPDLDRRELFAPVCRPLRRQRNRNEDSYNRGPAWLDYEQRAGWAIVEFSGQGYRSFWTLQRCGRKGPVVKSRSRPLFGDGIVAWRARRGVVALRLRDRRRFVWRKHEVVAVAGRRVFFTKPIDDSRSRVLSALIPR